MYIHLGEETVIEEKDILGIFDLENTTISKKTKDFLNNATKNNRVINVSYGFPKSFIITEKSGKITVYISQISSITLLKRKSLGIRRKV